MDSWPAVLQHHMGLLPLACLTWQAIVGRPHRSGWWWMAAAFAVSWVADSLAHVVSPAVTSTVYPAVQVAMMAVPLLLSWADAVILGATLILATAQAAVWYGMVGPDILLRVIAFGTIAALGWSRCRLRLLRYSLAIGFGGGLLAWSLFLVERSEVRLNLYQSTRLIGLLVFCVAAFRYRARPTAEAVPVAFPNAAFR